MTEKITTSQGQFAPAKHVTAKSLEELRTFIDSKNNVVWRGFNRTVDLNDIIIYSGADVVEKPIIGTDYSEFFFTYYNYSDEMLSKAFERVVEKYSKPTEYENPTEGTLKEMNPANGEITQLFSRIWRLDNVNFEYRVEIF